MMSFHQKGEHGASKMIGHPEFSVQDGRVRIDFLHQSFSESAEAIEFVFLPREHSALAAFDDGQGPETIMLNFINPIRVIKGLGPLSELKGRGNLHASQSNYRGRSRTLGRTQKGPI